MKTFGICTALISLGMIPSTLAQNPPLRMPLSPDVTIPAYGHTDDPASLRAAARPEDKPALQHFVCSKGYTMEKCYEQVAVLRSALVKLPLAQVGEWTWILVRSEEWGHILQDRGLSPSPAFSILPDRETFLEGVLVTKASIRGAQLSGIWRMTVENLLDLAVRHELGHALCNERNEAKADRIAAMLQKKKPISCDVQTAGARRLPTPRSGTRQARP